MFNRLIYELLIDLLRRCHNKSHRKHYRLLGDKFFSIIIDTSVDNWGVYLSLVGGSSKPDLTNQESKELDIILVKHRTFENGTSFDDYFNATNTITMVPQGKSEINLTMFFILSKK